MNARPGTGNVAYRCPIPPHEGAPSKAMFFQNNGKETAKAERRAMKEPFPLPRGHRNKAARQQTSRVTESCTPFPAAPAGMFPPRCCGKKEHISLWNGRNAPPGNKDERDAENGRGGPLSASWDLIPQAAPGNAAGKSRTQTTATKITFSRRPIPMLGEGGLP